MIVIIGIVSLLALHTTVAIQHPDFYKAANEKKAEWHYVGEHPCKSGKQEGGAYAIAVNGKVHFKQANKDGKIDKVICSGSE